MEEVVLVDFEDQPIGKAEKIQAHKESLLHRAFSVFLYSGDKLLLQKRASSKYHCGGLWTNTCCSHPRAGEETLAAAHRRLEEEMGIRGTSLKEIHSITYRYAFDNGLTEYEYDHIFVGEYDGTWVLDPEEVDDVKWVSVADLKEQLLKHPEEFTPWFIIAVKPVLEFLA